MCHQIRDEAFGLCLIEAPTAAAAIRTFFSRKVHAWLQPGDYKIADYHDGTASVLFRGFEYRSYQAVPASLIDERRVLDELAADMALLDLAAAGRTDTL